MPPVPICMPMPPILAGPSLRFLQIYCSTELSKVFTLSNSTQPWVNCIRVHRSDTLEVTCLLMVNAQRMYVTREGLGADIGLLWEGAVRKARYEETVVNRTPAYTLTPTPDVAYNATGVINDMNSNKHIVTLAVSDGHIHVIDSKTYAIRYIRPGGTMNPANQPKSFVANERKPGFSFAWVDETKVVGVLGNLMRVFDYEVD